MKIIVGHFCEHVRTMHCSSKFCSGLMSGFCIFFRLSVDLRGRIRWWGNALCRAVTNVSQVKNRWAKQPTLGTLKTLVGWIRDYETTRYISIHFAASSFDTQPVGQIWITTWLNPQPSLGFAFLLPESLCFDILCAAQLFNSFQSYSLCWDPKSGNWDLSSR